MNLEIKDLQRFQIFSTISEIELKELLTHHIYREFLPDQALIMEKDWGKSVWFIVKGIAKVRSFTNDGEEIIYSILGEGDIFGELAAIMEESRSADIVTLTKMEIIKIQGERYYKLITNSAKFALSIAKIESNKLIDLNQRFSINKSDATTRYLNSVAYLARKITLDSSVLSIIPKSIQKEIAIIAGLSRETASRTLSKLKIKSHISSEHEGIKINSIDVLVKRGLINNKQINHFQLKSIS